MYRETIFEKNRLRDRFKEIMTLAAFTIAIAVISLLVMNTLVFPVSFFAVKHKNAFNVIFKYLCIIGIITLLVSLVLRAIFRLAKAGLSAKEIALYMLRKPLYYISIFLIFLAASVVIVWLLYIIFSNNYYLLYKITGR